MVDLAEIGIVKRRGSNVCNEVISLTCSLGVCRRPELQQGLRNRICYGCPLGVGGYPCGANGRRHLTETFPGAEEKGLVSHDGSAECRAVLVTAQDVLLSPQSVSEEIRRIQ